MEFIRLETLDPLNEKNDRAGSSIPFHNSYSSGVSPGLTSSYSNNLSRQVSLASPQVHPSQLLNIINKKITKLEAPVLIHENNGHQGDSNNSTTVHTS